MRRVSIVVIALLILGGCASSPNADGEPGLGQTPEELAFVDDSNSIAAALVQDTLVGDAAGAQCAGERIAGQLDASQMSHIRQNSTLGGIDVSTAEARKLVDALVDCADPRDGVVAGMQASGLDPLIAACIGESIDQDIYADGLVHSLADGSANGLQDLATELDRATLACK